VRIAASLLALALGCGSGVATAPAPAPTPAPAAVAVGPARDLAVPEPYRPPPEKPPEPRDPRDPLLRDPRWPLLGDPRSLSPAGRRASREQVIFERKLARLDRAGADISGSELWEPCVRDFVRALPEPARRALTAALAYYETACAPGGGVALQGVRGLDGRGRRGRSDVGFTGTLSASRVDVSLRVASCDGATAAERIAIAADGERWSSPLLAFAEDAHGCAVAELPWTRSLAQAVWAAAGAADASIVFGGGAPDLAITDEMKQHLRAMLEALEALEVR
jgi:hypothetical protein